MSIGFALKRCVKAKGWSFMRDSIQAHEALASYLSIVRVK
jgi:hypothetical protein